jgi:hypothetical protein
LTFTGGGEYESSTVSLFDLGYDPSSRTTVRWTFSGFDEDAMTMVAKGYLAKQSLTAGLARAK